MNAASGGFGGVVHLIVKVGKSFQNVQRGENKVQSIYTDIISKKSVSFTVCTVKREFIKGWEIRSLSFDTESADWLHKVVVERATVVAFDLR